MPQINDSRPVHLLFERGSGFLAWIVRTFTRSKYAHVAIAFRDGSNWWVAEANADLGAVATFQWKSFRPGMYLCVPTRVGMTPEVRRFLFNEIQGQRYSWWDFVRAGAGLQPKEQGYQCAELVQRLFAVAGGSLPYSPTPQHILDQLRALPEHDEYVLEVP